MNPARRVTPSAFRLEEVVDRLVGRGVRRVAQRALGDEPARREDVVADGLQRPALHPRGDRQPLDLALEPGELERLAEPEERARDLLDRAPAEPRDRDDVGRVLERAAVGVIAGHLAGHALFGKAGRDLLALLAPLLGAERRQDLRELPERPTAVLDLRAQVEPGLGVAQVPAGGRLDEPVEALHQLPLRAAVDRPVEALDRLPPADRVDEVARGEIRADDVGGLRRRART